MRYKPTSGVSRSGDQQLSFELTSGTDVLARWDTSPEVHSEANEVTTGNLSRRDVVSQADPEKADLSRRIYPHMYEADAQTGVALSLVGRAKTEIESAVDAYLAGDIEEVSSRLGLVATNTAAAHRSTHFNEAFGAVVSFVRRATLAANVVDIELQQLMQLSKALNALHADPMLTLDSATDLVESLEKVGWHGQHVAVSELVASLIGELPDSSPMAVPERAS